MTSTAEKLKKAERTSEVAFAIINAEVRAREAKTAKLRKLREAQEVDVAASDDDSPKSRKRRATAKRSAPVKRAASAKGSSRKVGP